MDNVTLVGLAHAVLAGSLGFCPLAIAAISLIATTRDSKLQAGVARSVLAKYLVAIWLLVSCGVFAASVSIMALLFLLGMQSLSTACIVLFFVLILAQVSILVIVAFLLGK